MEIYVCYLYMSSQMRHHCIVSLGTFSPKTKNWIESNWNVDVFLVFGFDFISFFLQLLFLASASALGVDKLTDWEN